MNQADPSCASDADPTAMSMEEARLKILQLCPPRTKTEQVHIKDARHRITAVDIQARMSVPPFRSSAMDGYAFRHVEGSERLTLVGKSLAGHPFHGNIPPRSCVRITTGAMVPDDADTVVMQENVTLDVNSITINTLPTSGFNVRAIGSDHMAGRQLLAADTELKAAELALLAGHGLDTILVKRKINIAILSTGDELNDAGTELKPGGIYDSNRALLINMLESPAINCIDAGICEDSIESISSAFKQLKHVDLVISTGGVSVGDADFVRTVLESSGNLTMWKIAMKPGRPLTFGQLDSGALFFGLPGNPVSAAITCLFFVKPALRSLLGLPEIKEPITISAVLQSNLSKLPGRVEYQRGVLSGGSDAGYSVSTTGLQDSHVLTSLHEANCLVELPLSSRGAEAGDTVKTIPLNFIGDNLL